MDLDVKHGQQRRVRVSGLPERSTSAQRRNDANPACWLICEHPGGALHLRLRLNCACTCTCRPAAVRHQIAARQHTYCCRCSVIQMAKLPSVVCNTGCRCTHGRPVTTRRWQTRHPRTTLHRQCGCKRNVCVAAAVCAGPCSIACGHSTFSCFPCADS